MHLVDSHVIGVSARHGVWTEKRAGEIIKGRDEPLEGNVEEAGLQRAASAGQRDRRLGAGELHRAAASDRDPRSLPVRNDKVKTSPKGGTGYKGVVNYFKELLGALEGAT